MPATRAPSRPSRRLRGLHAAKILLLHEVAPEVHAGAYDLSANEVGVPTLAERLRGLRSVQLAAVVDLAERMQAGALRSDFEGRERVRRAFGISG